MSLTAGQRNDRYGSNFIVMIKRRTGTGVLTSDHAVHGTAGQQQTCTEER